MEDILTAFDGDASSKLSALADLSVVLSTAQSGALQLGQLRAIFVALGACVSSNNLKLSLQSLALLPSGLKFLTDQVQDGSLAPVMGDLLCAVCEKLGDAKANIRAAASAAALQILKQLTLRKSLARLVPLMSHKNANLREQIVSVIANAADETFYTDSPSISTIVPVLIYLMDDSKAAIRESTAKFLESIYAHDRKLRIAVGTAYSKTRNAHLMSLMQRFNEVDAESGMGLGEFPASADPVFVSCESELKSTIVEVEKALASDDWKFKVDALVKLQGLVVGGATSYKTFPSLVKTLEEPLHQQLRDLRSALIKETCTTVSVLAKGLGAAFANSGDVMIPTLLGLTCKTIEVIAESSHQCIQNLLRFCPVNCVSMLAQTAVNEKHKTARMKCSQYVLLLLEEAPVNVVEKHLANIESMILKAVGDADPVTRANSRKCFWALSQRWPDRAPKLQSQFEASTWVLVKKDEKYKERREADAVATTAKAASAPTNLSKEPKKASGAVRVVPPPVAPTTNPAAPTVNTSLMTTAASRTPLFSAEPMISLAGSVKPPSTPLMGGAVRILAVATSTPTVPATGLVNSRSASSVKDCAKRVPIDAPPKKAKALTASSDEVKAPKPALNKSQSTSAVKSTAAPPRPALHQSHSTKSIAIPQTQPSGILPLEDAQIMTHLMTQSGHANWAERVKALVDFSHHLINSEKFRTYVFGTSQRSEKVTTWISARLLDTHFKVAQQAVESIAQILADHPIVFKDCLHALLPNVFIVAFGTKSRDDTKAVVHRLLQSIETAFDIPSLVALSIKLLESSDAKVKFGSLKFVDKLASNPDADPSLSGANMPAVLRKLAKYSKWESSSELRGVTLQFLATLHNRHFASSTSAFLEVLGVTFSAKKQELMERLRPMLTVPAVLDLASVGDLPANISPIAEVAPVDDIALPSSQSTPSQKEDTAAKRARLQRTKSFNLPRSTPTETPSQKTPRTPGRSKSARALPKEADLALTPLTSKDSQSSERKQSKRVPMAQLSSKKAGRVINNTANTPGSYQDAENSDPRIFGALLRFVKPSASPAQKDNTTTVATSVPEVATVSQQPEPIAGSEQQTDLSASAGVPLELYQQIESILPHLADKDTLQLLATVVAQLSRTDLLATLKSLPIITTLEKNIASRDAQVRRGAVLLVVEMKLTLGDDLAPFLQEMSEDKKQLIAVHYDKQKMLRPVPQPVCTEPIAVL